MPAARTASQMLAMKVESRAVPGRDGFRRPRRSVVKNVGTARDHGVAAPTQGIRRPARLRSPTRSVLKTKRVDPAHPCISAAMGVVMPAGLWGVA